MQNSLDRLLEGVVHALREAVLPAVDDDYARTQLLAAAEVLANVAVRVEWRCASLRSEVDGVRAVLAVAAAAVPGAGLDPVRALLARAVPDDNAGLVAARVEHLAALAQAQGVLAALPDGTAAPARAAVAAFLRERLEADRALLRTGMFRG